MNDELVMPQGDIHGTVSYTLSGIENGIRLETVATALQT